MKIRWSEEDLGSLVNTKLTVSWQGSLVEKASSSLGCMRQSIASRSGEVMLSLWGAKPTNHRVDADTQVFSKIPTDGFAALLTVAGWICCSYCSPCIGLCLAGVCSQADGRPSSHHQAQQTHSRILLPKTEEWSPTIFLWTEGFYFFFFNLVDMATC